MYVVRVRSKFRQISCGYLIRDAFADSKKLYVEAVGEKSTNI